MAGWTPAAGSQQQPDKRGGLFGGCLAIVGFPLIPEDLLELIDDDQQVSVLSEAALPRRFDQTQGTTPQGDFHARRIEDTLHRLGQVVDGGTAGICRQDLPIGSLGGKKAGSDRGNQARSGERRLAGSRAADHGDESRIGQFGEKVAKLLVAPKEKRFVLLVEVMQSEKRDLVADCRRSAHEELPADCTAAAPLIRSRYGLRTSATVAGEYPSNSATSRTRMSSLSSRRGFAR